MDPTLVFGYPEEWRAFQDRNRRFLEKFPTLKEALDTAYVRQTTVSTSADKAILFLGRLCIEDFMELLCLAANGYGIGAMKLLRGLYERAVTASYLALHPEDAQAFLEFRFISRHKALQAYLGGGTTDVRWKKRALEVAEDYEKVRERFRVTDCKKCATTKVNHTWSALDFASMAKSTALGILLAQAYYEPLNHAHSTAEAIMTRLERQADGEIGFKPGPQRNDADRAVQVAHSVLVALLEVQAKHFAMPALAEKAATCAEDYVEVWARRKIAVDPEAR
jgi:hypothetical protein